MLNEMSTKELEAEIDRRKNKGKGEAYKGFFLQESTYQDGHYVPGPRSPGEDYDYYTTEYKVEIRDGEGSLLKTVYGRLPQARIYVDHHLTPEGLEAKAKARVEFEALEKKLTESRQAFKKMQEDIWKLERNYYDLRDYVEGR